MIIQKLKIMKMNHHCLKVINLFIKIELGFDFRFIYKKILASLNPLRSLDNDIIQDADLAGPIIFCFGLGLLLLLVFII